MRARSDAAQARGLADAEVDRRLAEQQRHELGVDVGEMEKRDVADGSKRSSSACDSRCCAKARDHPPGNTAAVAAASWMNVAP